MRETRIPDGAMEVLSAGGGTERDFHAVPGRFKNLSTQSSKYCIIKK